MSKPNILITNDDGIYAPGLRHLWNAVKTLGNTAIVAPDRDCSGTAMGITVTTPLQAFKTRDFEGTPSWMLNGRPTDCVKMAVSSLLDTTPELIISGINRGSNAGRNVLYSGTVAAAIEGAMRGISGIAFSCVTWHSPTYEVFLSYIEPIVMEVLNNPLPAGTMLNINFPDLEKLELKEPKGVRLARQGKQYWGEDPIERKHPCDGTIYHWLGGKIRHFKENPDADITLLEEGYITVVPIDISDLTNEQLFQERKQFNHLGPLVAT